MNSDNEMNPLKAIQRIKELNKSLAERDSQISQEPKKKVNKNLQNKNTQNKTTQNKTTQNKTTQNKNTQNKDTQNKDTQRKNTQNKNTQNKNTQNKTTQNRNNASKNNVSKTTQNKNEISSDKAQKQAEMRALKKRKNPSFLKNVPSPEEQMVNIINSDDDSNEDNTANTENNNVIPKNNKPKNNRPKNNKKKSNKNNKKVKIIPLGGLESIGMNITAFEYEDSIIVVDCGLAFPSDDMPGIDLVIPDVSYLKDNYLKVKGFFITHGHEDHIGALPYILKQLNVPVYGTKLTCALIERKLKEHGLDKTAKLNIVKHGQTVEVDDFKVEFVKTNHSIQDASALAIFSPAGVIFHTGDFKIDYTPIFGEPADLQRMAEIGKAGVLAMLCDSTNAIKPGFTMSERTVGRTFHNIFEEHKNNRIIVATFASNVDRVQQIINTAYEHGRKVVVEGRSTVFSGG